MAIQAERGEQLPGIFVLTGIAVGEAGPGAIIAFALNGVVTLFTALSYAELASAIPEAGG